jgi:acetoin utilization deacetylase AcuC-like enzyme
MGLAALAACRRAPVAAQLGATPWIERATAAPAVPGERTAQVGRGPAVIPVFFDPRQHTDANESFSPSAGKPAKVVESWKDLQIPLRFHAVEPASPELIALAHSREYVDGVLAARVANGFGNTLPEVAGTLPWTIGSFVSAVVHVARHGGVAASPTSGFHHAHYDHGAGFCTFNGLVVAVRALQTRGLARRVGILDCDVHFGDGTTEILERLQVPEVVHWTFGAHYGSPAQGEEFIEKLPEVLAEFERCEVVLYQAGADPFIDDPLGGVLTKEQLRRRDRVVFQHFASAGIPLVWNLAGGYSRDSAGTIEPVLEIHDATMQECHAAYAAAAAEGVRAE